MEDRVSIRLGEDLCKDFPDINLAVLKAEVPVQKELDQAEADWLEATEAHEDLSNSLKDSV